MNPAVFTLAGLASALGLLLVDSAVNGAAVQLPRDTGASQQDEQPSILKPKHESAQSLFKKWQESARTDGKIPGGAFRSLANGVARFIKLNPTHKLVPQLTDLARRIDTSHDWTPADAVALLDDLTAIYPTLPDWAQSDVGASVVSSILAGQPLPAELADAAWGPPAAHGLRAAWLLEPAAAQYALGTNLKTRILFHNSGTQTIVFQTADWHQYQTHKARDAKGATINVSATDWTRLTKPVAIRLAPGEYAETESHAIGIGKRNPGERDGNWAGLRVGAWIEAKEGDEVTFQPAAVTASSDRWTPPADRRTPLRMWWEILRDRIDREGPMPAAAADREQLIRRVLPELIGVPPTQEEIATFVADNSPNALTALANRLVSRIAPFAGELPSGEIKFRIIAADPEAAKKPRVATGPGHYVIGDHVRLVIQRSRKGDRRVDEASIMFFSPDPKAEPPYKPHDIKLPDGPLAWAIGWEPGSTVLWSMQQGLVRKYDFTNPARVEKTTLEGQASVDQVPQPVLDALRAALAAPGKPQPTPPEQEGR